MIQISQAAAKEIKRLKQLRQQPDNLFRLSVKSGGCSGLFYNLELDTLSSQNQTKETVEDSKTVLNQKQDHSYESNGVTVVVDEHTYSYVQGLKLDYSEDLMGGGFRFQNPNATSTCKCGLSFKTTEI